MEESNNKTRKIVGLVIFDGERFLLLHRKLNWSGWEFAKGEIEIDEDEKDAVERELFEETGIKKFEIIDKIDEFDYFDEARKLNTHIKNFLLRVSSNSKVKINNANLISGEIIIEHDDFKWYFPKDAVKTLTHDNQRETVEKAIKLLGLSE